ncbi:MAG: hypothetical protein SFU86_14655 [Pirellulaceae bacterium]|nr:hypothetical protein [Pirellulaceae bacterium]
MSSYPPAGPPGNYGPPGGFGPPPSPYSVPPGSPYGMPVGNPYGLPPPSPPASPLAILSMLGGIVSMLFGWVACCGFLSPFVMVGSLATVVMGHMALGQISRSQGKVGGTGLAMTGLITGYPTLAWSTGMLIFTIITMSMGALNPPNTTTAQANGPTTILGSLEDSAAQEALDKVESRIRLASNGVAQGNTPEAVALAQKFADTMKTLRQALFTAGKPGVSLSGGQFVTWCELREDSCAFVVHVPSYRNFDDEAQESLEQLAWNAAQSTVRGTLQEGNELAVGMKGVILYGGVLVGTVVAEGSEDDGLEEHGDDEELLLPFFEPPAEALPTTQPAGEPTPEAVSPMPGSTHPAEDPEKPAASIEKPIPQLAEKAVPSSADPPPGDE